MTDTLFDVTGKCIVITGGAGVLCGQMARSLAELVAIRRTPGR